MRLLIGQTSTIGSTLDVKNDHSRAFRSGICGCQEINECNLVPSVYPSNAVCTNTDGGYKCDCDDGYLGVSTTSGSLACIDKNECDDNNGCCHVPHGI